MDDWNGWPLDTDISQWHWLQPHNLEREKFPARWSATFQQWEINSFFYRPGAIAKIYSYGGICTKDG